MTLQGKRYKKINITVKYTDDPLRTRLCNKKCNKKLSSYGK